MALLVCWRNCEKRDASNIHTNHWYHTHHNDKKYLIVHIYIRKSIREEGRSFHSLLILFAGTSVNISSAIIDISICVSVCTYVGFCIIEHVVHSLSLATLQSSRISMNILICVPPPPSTQITYLTNHCSSFLSARILYHTFIYSHVCKYNLETNIL
jgi:hypothetical protein